MTRDEAIVRLRAGEPELRSMGIERLSLFGSVARGEERSGSDVDLAAVMDYDRVRSLGPLGFFTIEPRLEEMLGTKIDLVTEPARRPRLQANIDRDRISVF